jgi:hypothetical protein
MNIKNIALGVALIMAMLSLAGCSHRLIAHNGETNVAVYPNKEDFDKIASMKSQGGPAGMIGGMGQSLMAKQVPGNTPVKVLSSDDEGADVEVLEGPNKGLRGYVAKDNLH